MKRINKYLIFFLFLPFITCSSLTDTSTSLSIVTVQIGFSENISNIDIDSQIKIKLLQDDIVVRTEYLLWYKDEYKLNIDIEPGNNYRIKAFAYKNESIKYSTHSEIFNVLPGERRSVELIMQDSNNVIFPTGNLSNTKIAFYATRDVHSHIFKMNPDGTDQRQITFDDYNNRHPSWSPDRDKIIYCKRTWAGVWELFKINENGTDDIQLTFRQNSDECPQWSPDGSKIVFQSYLDTMEIWVINSDGTNMVNLTDSNYNCAEPFWSPDGLKIVYQCEKDNNWDIYIMNSNGTNKERITYNSSSEIDPIISPDGSKIAFMSDRDGNYEIYTMNIDGLNQTRLTFNEAYDGAPSWSPDGSMIAFDSDRDGNYEIYIMNADGSNQINITNTPARERCPVWSNF